MKKEHPDFDIRPFEEADQAAVIALWQKCGLLRPWNNPERDIARKLGINRELFLGDLLEGKIVASVMGGYEGHCGWLNYLAVDPDYQKNGLGRRIVNVIETKLTVLGCPKVNLQVRLGNHAAMAFYEKIGYSDDADQGYGKRLIKDN